MDRLAFMTDEIDRLRARIEMLEEALGVRSLTPREWQLTASEMRVFGVLEKRPLATRK